MLLHYLLVILKLKWSYQRLIHLFYQPELGYLYNKEIKSAFEIMYNNADDKITDMKGFWKVYLYLYICKCAYVCGYIVLNIYICIYFYTYMYIFYTYMYAYIYAVLKGNPSYLLIKIFKKLEKHQYKFP